MIEVDVKLAGEIQTLSLKPGDVVVLRMDSPLPWEAYEHISAKLNKMFPNNQSVVLEPGAELSVVSPDAASQPPSVPASQQVKNG